MRRPVADPHTRPPYEAPTPAIGGETPPPVGAAVAKGGGYYAGGREATPTSLYLDVTLP